MRASRSQFLEFSQPQAKFYKLKFNKKGARAFTALHEKCPYSESFWSLFYGIQSECGKYGLEKLRIRTLFTHIVLVFLLQVLNAFTKLTLFTPMLHFYTP